jgi:hypothetical protein
MLIWGGIDSPPLNARYHRKGHFLQWRVLPCPEILFFFTWLESLFKEQ